MERAPSPLPSCEDSEELVVYEPGNRPSPNIDSADTLTLDFPAPGTVRNKYLSLIRQLVYSILL